MWREWGGARAAAGLDCFAAKRRLAMTKDGFRIRKVRYEMHCS
jgi:hypothetical protein